MSGDHRHQRPLTSLEKQDSWLSGLLYHVIFFSDLYISIIRVLVNKHVYKQSMIPYNQLMISFTFHHPHVLPR